MQYRDFGNTGVKISALGFGAMRLPMTKINGNSVVDEDMAIPIIRKAYEKGVNYFDSAYGYCSGQSEIVLGKAIKGFRDKIYVSSKFPHWGRTDKSDYRRVLEEQLKRLDISYIDFYHIHDINADDFRDIFLKNGFMEEAFKAKDEGLIRHLSFSSHDKPESIKYIVDTGYFETLLCQYNFLNRANENMMTYARQKGLGIVVMGPVAGGRIAGLSPEIAEKLGITVKNNSEPAIRYAVSPTNPTAGYYPVRNNSDLAIRFVLANPNVDCALSGMSSLKMVEENVETASRSNEPLTDKEANSLKGLMDEYEKLSELYCTGCNYCLPCPQGVNIPYIFSQMNNYRIYGLKDSAREQYSKIGIANGVEGEKADKCIECGVCEDKCPQKIQIIKKLKECAEVLA